jgi:hypothetical protein
VHRAEKWKPVFGKSDAQTITESIAPKSGSWFSAEAMHG